MKTSDRWGCEVHHDPFNATFTGDCEFGLIKFRDDLPRAEINQIAQLISAAPDLLEACKVALARMELAMANDHSCGSESGIRYAHCEQVRAAIKKAEYAS